MDFVGLGDFPDGHVVFEVDDTGSSSSGKSKMLIRPLMPGADRWRSGASQVNTGAVAHRGPVRATWARQSFLAAPLGDERRLGDHRNQSCRGAIGAGEGCRFPRTVFLNFPADARPTRERTP